MSYVGDFLFKKVLQHGSFLNPEFFQLRDGLVDCFSQCVEFYFVYFLTFGTHDIGQT